MKILYLGDTWPDGTCTQRRNALTRLGHKVTFLNPADLIPARHIPFFASFNVRTGYRIVARSVDLRMRSRLSRENWDLVWIDCGSELPPSFYRWLCHRRAPIINYMTDNPFQKRDFRKWDLYRQSITMHDLTVLPREENIAQAFAAGAKNVMRVYFSYDPVAHAPSNHLVPKKYDVIFVGSWMPERGPIALELLRSGIDLKIAGDAWPRSPEWKLLSKTWLGPSIYGRCYVEAIESGRIAIGLLSKGNRDLHTQRSVEVPFIGSAVFCAERTSEHMGMYREGEQAIFWDTPKDCAITCKKMLSNYTHCHSMASSARKRVIDLKLSNDEVLTSILNHPALSRAR